MRTTEETKAFLRTLYSRHFGEVAFGSAVLGDGASHTDDRSASGLSEDPYAPSNMTGASIGTMRSAVFVSAPGRVELAGNHTDHQGGRTISAAIDQRAYALAIPNDSDEIHLFMDGFGEASLHLGDLKPHPDEQGSSIALVRGMAAAYARSGETLCGFNMVTCSDIPVGCGLSSSAAFEMLVGATIRALCDEAGKAEPHGLTALALEGVWAEHAYFNKPCGAQDQLASAYGGIACMDFAGELPIITPIAFDPHAFPYSLCLVDSRCDHSHFTDEYAAIPADMHAVAQYFGSTELEGVPYQAFLKQLPALRAQLGDRPILRALHYFEETRRVKAQAEALQAGDFEAFIELVRLSGASSAQFLQNVSPRADGSGSGQPAMMILALCAHLLDGADEVGRPEGGNGTRRPRGAYRIHGGGFGGSVLVFVPSHKADSFCPSMDALLGYEACRRISIGARGVSVERLF